MDVKQQHGSFLHIRVCGLQRSGNHAVIDWIIAQHKGKSNCFLNNVRHGNHDPYKNHKQKFCVGLDDQAETESLRSEYKHLLIYSYEDDQGQMGSKKDLLESVFDPEFERSRLGYLRNAEHSLDVLIIRDPFNFFASRLKKLDWLSGEKDLKLIAHNWKMLAQEAIQIENTPRPERLVVNFNQWLKEKKYRRILSEQMFGSYDDSSMMNISRVGMGSSFDSLDYSPLTWRTIFRNWTKIFDPKKYLNMGEYINRFFYGAKKMKVMDRWKTFVNNSLYQSIFADKEIMELSEEIFGEIPGTREFVLSIKS